MRMNSEDSRQQIADSRRSRSIIHGLRLNAPALQHRRDMSSNFRNILAWQKGVELAVEMYRVCENFPRHEQFGLTRQMRNAAVSIPSNIAEGRGRGTIPDYR